MQIRNKPGTSGFGKLAAVVSSRLMMLREAAALALVG